MIEENEIHDDYGLHHLLTFLYDKHHFRWSSKLKCLAIRLNFSMIKLKKNSICQRRCFQRMAQCVLFTPIIHFHREFTDFMKWYWLSYLNSFFTDAISSSKFTVFDEGFIWANEVSCSFDCKNASFFCKSSSFFEVIELRESLLKLIFALLFAYFQIYLCWHLHKCLLNIERILCFQKKQNKKKNSSEHRSNRSNKIEWTNKTVWISHVNFRWYQLIVIQCFKIIAIRWVVDNIDIKWRFMHYDVESE